MGPQLLEAINQIAKEKEIDKNIIIDALEQRTDATSEKSRRL